MYIQYLVYVHIYTLFISIYGSVYTPYIHVYVVSRLYAHAYGIQNNDICIISLHMSYTRVYTVFSVRDSMPYTGIYGTWYHSTQIKRSHIYRCMWYLVCDWTTYNVYVILSTHTSYIQVMYISAYVLYMRTYGIYCVIMSHRQIW